MKTIFFTLALLVTFAGCASKAEKSAVRAKAEKSSVTGIEALSETIDDTIKASEHLSTKQKDQLRKILTQNKQRSEELTAKSYQFRSVLIKELLSNKLDKKKVGIIKRDIKMIEKEKLENTFETIEKITQIVSDSPDKQKFSKPLMNIERNLR